MELTNEEIIKRVRNWQSAGFVHPLTCRWKSSHKLLEPVEKDGKVILVCPTCKKEQLSIPPSVINLDPAILEEQKQKLTDLGAKF